MINFSLSKLLDLISLEDVLAAIIFRIDGEVLQIVQKENTQYNTLFSTVLNWCKENIKQVSIEMRNNNLAKVTYELNNTTVLFFVINSISILTIVGVKNANLSLLSIEAKRKALSLSSEI